MRSKSVLGLLICIALVFSLSFAQPANAASAEEEIAQIATNFGKALDTCDINMMSSLWWHSPQVSLFGPGKNEAFLIQGYEQIINNFKSMFGLPPGTYKTCGHNTQITMLDDNSAIITLCVTTTFNPPAVKEQTIYLDRATMVVQKKDGKWLLVHVHVSLFPAE